MKKGCYPSKYMEANYTPRMYLCLALFLLLLLLFSKLSHYLRVADPRSNKLPSEDDVFLFVNPICHKLRVKPESGVLALVYIERLISATELTLSCFNWRKVVLSCIILATKVYEEVRPSRSLRYSVHQVTL